MKTCEYVLVYRGIHSTNSPAGETKRLSMRFEVLMAMIFHVAVYWVETPCRIPTFCRTMLLPSLGEVTGARKWT
jgi:hypothetical protein